MLALLLIFPDDDIKGVPYTFKIKIACRADNDGSKT